MTFCGLNGSLAQMYSLQRKLAMAQAVPIYGPVVVSPVKALISLAQAIIGVVGAIFGKIKEYRTQDKSWSSHTAVYLHHTLMGTAGLIYSVVNLKTFGFIGLNIEIFFDPSVTQII